MGNMDGYWLWSEDSEGGRIAICTDLSYAETIATFLEEWAHARTAYLLDTEEETDDPHHHPTFWAELGRITLASRDRQF